MSGSTERERSKRRKKQLISGYGLENEGGHNKNEILSESLDEDKSLIQMADLGIPSAIAEFYFSKKLNSARDEILADCTNKEQWTKLLEAYKEGEIDEDEIIDVISTSHLNCDPEIYDAKEAHAKTVRDVLTGKVGFKMMETIVEDLQVSGLLPNSPDSKIKALISAGIIEEEKEEENSSKEISKVEISKKQRKNARKRLKEKIKQRCNVILHDKIIRVKNVEKLIAKLEDDEDPDFDISRRAIIDANWERREGVLAIYTIALSNISPQIVEKEFEETYAEEREIIKYIIEAEISKEQLEHLFLIIISKYKKYLFSRFENVKETMEKLNKFVEESKNVEENMLNEKLQLQWDKINIQPYDNRLLDDLIKVFPQGFWYNSEDYEKFVVEAGIASKESQLAEYNGVLIGKTKYIPKFEVAPHIENTIADLEIRKRDAEKVETARE